MIVTILLSIEITLLIALIIYTFINMSKSEKRRKELDTLMAENLKVRILKIQNDLLNQLKENENEEEK